MYYLTVIKGIEKNDELFSRKEFHDFGEALEFCSKFYSPCTTSNRNVLTFTTETIDGKFARAYTELNRPEDIDVDETYGESRYSIAAKYSNRFHYDESFFFLIESCLGIEYCDE